MEVDWMPYLSFIPVLIVVGFAIWDIFLSKPAVFTIRGVPPPPPSLINKSKMQIETQQQQQQQQFNLAQELTKRFQNALDQVKFPEGKISGQWMKAARHALKFASPISLGFSAADMKNHVQSLFKALDEGSISMLQFAMLANTIEQRSMKDMDCLFDMEKYFDIQEETERLSKIWNDENEAMRAKIEQDLIAELSTKQKLEENKSILKAVKAEA